MFQVRKLTVRLDGQLVSPTDGFLIRKGPGSCHFDFAQLILFGAASLCPLLPGTIMPTHPLYVAAVQLPFLVIVLTAVQYC